MTAQEPGVEAPLRTDLERAESVPLEKETCWEFLYCSDGPRKEKRGRTKPFLESRQRPKMRDDCETTLMDV